MIYRKYLLNSPSLFSYYFHTQETCDVRSLVLSYECIHLVLFSPLLNWSIMFCIRVFFCINCISTDKRLQCLLHLSYDGLSGVNALKTRILCTLVTKDLIEVDHSVIG